MTNQGAAGHSIRRAKVILWEAEMLSEAGHWSLTVRRAQECVELALKGALVWAGVDVPKMHDVGPLLRQHAERFPAEFSSAIPTLASTSRALRAEREISFYGDPESGIPPENLCGGDDALRLCKGRGSLWSTARFSFPSTRPVLRVDMGNPFAFYRVYDRAAAQLGKPAFSRAALETLGYLEDKYVR